MEIILKILKVLINIQKFSSICWTNVYCSQEFVDGFYSDLNEIYNSPTLNNYY